MFNEHYGRRRQRMASVVQIFPWARWKDSEEVSLEYAVRHPRSREIAQSRSTKRQTVLLPTVVTPLSFGSAFPQLDNESSRGELCQNMRSESTYSEQLSHIEEAVHPHISQTGAERFYV